MTEHYTLRLTIQVRAPFLSHGTSPGLLEYDAVALRDHDQVIIPGSQIKGLLRDAWRQLGPYREDSGLVPCSKTIADWLGSPSKEAEKSSGTAAETNAPARGKLHFSDFRARQPATESHRYRVSIDEYRGSVAPMMLASVETPFPAGAEVDLEGTITLVADQATAITVERAVETGLRFVSHLGALRGQGFGRVVAITTEAMVAKPLAAEPARLATGTDSAPIELILTTGDPLLIAASQPNTNLFQATAEIPGAVLKGSVASSWRELCGKSPSGAITPDLDPQREVLATHFAKVRFTHAFLTQAPQTGEPVQRPVAIPQSLVELGSSGEPKVLDVALLDGPHIIDGEAPRFQIDWKSKAGEEARELCGWPEPKRRMRVRTAIDPKTHRAAEGQLFAQNSLVLCEDQVLTARVDLSMIEDPVARSHATAELQSLLVGGLRHVGKTKATLRHSTPNAPGAAPAIPKVAKTDRASTDPLIMVLQTPALLADPYALSESSGANDLAACYASAFNDLSQGRLELVRYFSVEKLAGGEYYRRRFQAPSSYHPYLLTDAGSVFVFARDPAATSCLESWERQGMPLPTWVCERFAAQIGGEAIAGDDWRRCPFLPAGGYGEIAFDLALHWQLRAAPARCIEARTLDRARQEDPSS